MRLIHTVMGSLRRFATQNAGAVTVDYVVLTAAVTIMGLGALASIRTGTDAMSAQIDLNLGSSSRSSNGVNSGWQGGGVPVGYNPGAPSEPGFDPDTAYIEPPSDAGEEDGDVAAGDADGEPNDPAPNDDAPDHDAGTDPNPPETQPQTPGNGQGRGNGQAATDPASAEIDFHFEDLFIGCYWGNRAVSQWLTLNLAQDTRFLVYGDGNPVAHVSQGKASARGKLRWGTNIQVDIPPPGTSRTVFMELGEELGSFTLHRAACP